VAVRSGGKGRRERLHHDFPVAHEKGVGCQPNSRLGFPNDICDLAIHVPAEEISFAVCGPSSRRVRI